MIAVVGVSASDNIGIMIRGQRLLQNQLATSLSRQCCIRLINFTISNQNTVIKPTATQINN